MLADFRKLGCVARWLSWMRKALVAVCRIEASKVGSKVKEIARLNDPGKVPRLQWSCSGLPMMSESVGISQVIQGE